MLIRISGWTLLMRLLQIAVHSFMLGHGMPDVLSAGVVVSETARKENVRAPGFPWVKTVLTLPIGGHSKKCEVSPSP